MRRPFSSWALAAIAVLCSFSAFSQQSTTVSGSVKNSKTGESIPAVSVAVKGGTSGTYTDDNGNFKFTTSQRPPFTLVFSSIGFATKESVVNGSNLTVDVKMDFAYSLGSEIVVSASRVPERILESPVSIERLGIGQIRNAAAATYYDMLGNLKGVDVVTSSLTFKSVGTRGFNVNGNSRLNQLVDGMDNQAPGLNFSVGGIVGLTELDVESMELLPGASSALYGSGGMNGTVLINSKDPFKYQGLSFQIKGGVNHVDNFQRQLASYYDWSIRWAKQVSDRFAYKINAQMIQAQDWLANDKRDYSRTTGTPLGQVVSGDRNTDPNYDGVNVYGDETTSSLSGVAGSVINGLTASLGAPTFNAIYGASNAYLTGTPTATIAQYNTFLNGIGGAGLVSGGYSTFLYGNIRNYYTGVNVSRTGYDEKDIINPTTVNFKLTGGLYYKLSDKVTASFSAYFGTGSSVYTGTDRYSLKDLRIGQYKLELRHKDWYLRAYTTQEDAGQSYDATITTRYFNEAVNPSTNWYPTYTSAFTQYVAAGLTPAAAHVAARATADAGRPSGPLYNNPLFQKIATTPISKGGGLFLDQTNLYNYEGQLDLTNILDLGKRKIDLLIGGNLKQYVLNSQGTLFADTSGKININETGVYAQVSKRYFDDYLKLTASGRYDKNSNFDGHFTPRFSAVVKLAQDHNLRFSYQTAYRFPTTQNQWINLAVGSGTRLIGGLPQFRDYYHFASNPAYTLASYQAYLASGNSSVLQAQTFGDFKPESSNSFEAGYKGLFGKRLLIDLYFYWGQYTNFLSSVTAVQSNNGTAAGLATSATVYSISVNSPTTVNTMGWGVSAEWLMRNNFSLTGNIYSDNIGALPVGFSSYFNTPQYRANIGFSNTGFLYHNRVGFSMVWRYQDSFYYEGTFGAGQMSSFGTIDGAVSYKFPAIRSLLKLGASNVLNSYYNNGFGNAQVGGVYYVSFGYNVF